MSEFTEHNKDRVKKLVGYFKGLMDGRNGTELLNEFQILETKFIPLDVVQLFDVVFEMETNMDKIKIASNKLFNILFKTLSEYPEFDYPKNSIIKILTDNNRGVWNELRETRKFIKEINQQQSKKTIDSLLDHFNNIEAFTSHYTIKENIIFPEIENIWANNKCLKLIWSFQDDIRRNIKKTIAILKPPEFDLKSFNQISSKLYFNINTIIFREEKVLFPVMYETLSNDIFQKMLAQINEFEMKYVKCNIELESTETSNNKDSLSLDDDNKTIKFGTGEMTIEQIEMVFNHLPVDLTFVDENNRVKYFSTPKHRIFPRTKGVIGRLVQDCHPHESVDVVNDIVSSFKSGEKDLASFWIKMGPNFVLIKYFAVRDKNGLYKGVLEVSQEISEIRNIEGERRLLDWEE